MKEGFPILNSNPKEYIPLEVIKAHEKQAIINHGQTLDRLSQRGGLDWKETLCVLEDREFGRDKKAKEKVIKIVKDN
ncbi:hypothetical protein [Clostridium sp.]|uniref:hypothetical protein n=1 Tax=Clostridium sp. TaxID=1506 RepID=UPI00321739B7